jgi:hypothetical protein
MKSGNLNFLEHSGPLQACNGNALPSPLPYDGKNVYYSLVEISMKHVELKTCCPGFNFNTSTPVTYVYCKPYRLRIITLIKLNSRIFTVAPCILKIHCTRNNAHTNTWSCHITHHNEIFIILISDFSQEKYVLPDDDMQCAIEICRSSESVLMCIILD